MINLVVQERVQFASCHATTTYDSSWLKSRITLDRQRRGREKSARGVKKKGQVRNAIRYTWPARSINLTQRYISARYYD